MNETHTQDCSALDLGCHVEFFSNEIARFFQWVLEKILDGFIAFLSIIPVPQFLSEAQTLNGTMPASVLYFTDVFQLDTGLLIVVSAYLFRFILRRLPFIG